VSGSITKLRLQRVAAIDGRNAEAASANGIGVLSENHFRQMLCRERKRSERSRKYLLLALVDGKDVNHLNGDSGLLHKIANCLSEIVRETDFAGWHKEGTVFGIIFTELGETEIKAAINVIQAKITAHLQKTFKPVELNKILVSFYAFPEGMDINSKGNGTKTHISPALYPDVFEVGKRKRLSLLAKRATDIVGSSFALALLSPVVAFLSAAIKLSSKGPVFFRQERIGQYGVPFQFLKFRSMRVSNDSGIHEEYVKKFIAGKASQGAQGGQETGVYKITNDPRVTWLGKIMRRTSLDELPQFWNVLKGEMSLVGPRPPIRYEMEAYDVWHRRRLVEVKPGITGLWQVHGRSKTTFDEMVRLDLTYSRTWSPLLDAKILLRTPRAVISGDGAY
jgi:lipopolysaccharide/colanic/teichoic acid biosynthesis glycosyltransferase/GGDEF domain-containing protein